MTNYQGTNFGYILQLIISGYQLCSHFSLLSNKSIHTKFVIQNMAIHIFFRLQPRVLLPDIYQNIGYEKIVLKNDYQRIDCGRLSGEYSISI